MRPTKLSVKGFTAFRDEQTIDFNGLDLFAVAGPTGAGKSSILDAMTYALYGKVERVGNECGQLISLGLQNMAVSLEFSCAPDEYLITRRLSRKTGTDVVIAKRQDAEWVPLAGKVREVGEAVERVIGLDYEGFTRAVLLPQGKFSQFLAGDAPARRKILTDLLGLQLFERMGAHARKLQSAADVEMKTKRKFLDDEYAHVSAEAVESAHRKVATARDRENRITRVHDQVRVIHKRWDDARESAKELRGCADEADGYAQSAADVLKQLTKLAGHIEHAQKAVATRSKEATDASSAAEKAKKQYDKAVEKRGSLHELNEAKTKAVQLESVRDNLTKLQGELSTARDAPKALKVSADRANGTLTKAEQDLVKAKERVTTSRDALETIRHDQRVAAVAKGLRKGDPCPICGARLEKVPSAGPATAALRAAEVEVGGAEKAATIAQQRAGDAKLKASDAHRRVEAAETEITRIKADIAAAEKRATTLETALVPLVGPELPDRPAEVLDERITALEHLKDEADGAVGASASAKAALAEAKQQQERIATSIAEQKGRIPAVAAAGLIKRGRKLMADVTLPSIELELDDTWTAAQLSAAAGRMATALGDYSKAVRAIALERAGSEAAMLTEANALAATLVPTAKSLDALMAAAEAAQRDGTAARASAENDMIHLSEALERKQQLVADIERLQQLWARLRDIALDLRQDAIVNFLQAQALTGLAADGSARLRELSAERYELRYRDDEFYVADTWNGAEERTVKTLSGGEMFLASLALALSLSGQVNALSASGPGRLDSLFLDEGFSYLDPGAVDLVVDGLERLGSDGRMVGVVTHLRAVTDQFPRLEVEKLPTGSRVSLVM